MDFIDSLKKLDPETLGKLKSALNDVTSSGTKDPNEKR